MKASNIFLVSPVVERMTVNHDVAGSNPARGARVCKKANVPTHGVNKKGNVQSRLL